MELYGDANYLKGGLVYADALTTVSPTYAEEIKTPFYGENLDGLMCARANDLRGIVNGLDYQEWNPVSIRTDRSKRYTVRYASAMKRQKTKQHCRKNLDCRKDTKDALMIGIVSRLTDQKGI